MKEINDLKYSKKPFQGYKYRAKVEMQIGKNDFTTFDVYTTSTDRIGTELNLKSLRKYSIMPLKIIHWNSKEQDDRDSEFIDEVLKNI